MSKTRYVVKLALVGIRPLRFLVRKTKWWSHLTLIKTKQSKSLFISKMAAKGSAAKSASGASMSKYDVEVEGRLQKLEAAVHSHEGGEVSSDLEAMIKEVYTWYLDARTKV